MAKQYNQVRLLDEYTSIVHSCYDDIRTDCGICWSMYRKDEYKFVEVGSTATCIPCTALRSTYPPCRT